MEKELSENTQDYFACRLCEFDVVLVRKKDVQTHLEEVHSISFNNCEGGVDEIILETMDDQLLGRCYNEKTLNQLRDDLNEEKQNDFYNESGKDLSIFEATETLKVAILLFLTEFKRKIVSLNFPNVQVKNLENDQLNKFLLANQGAFYYYSLIDLARIEDITVQMLLARSWDWSEEDQDLRREITNIRDGIIPNTSHSSHVEALQCVNTGKMLLLTMHESIKHLLLLCYLTKKVIKRQD
ncbi:uncharacterized protein cubi_01957 [Cryptosporidium ubiquitum]|uniref:Uncharacterized protein n=1 Tax=Cryptosporidium ubiquitum TaxID=857276 RepID=A0A1J4MR06_9CRYT|nr:uncharacterized protein cubi_01957 [Cryptosporidium ubiquitum]OII75436.1 hypothetical protein cubi_01957 [Cryptosporidium ubiquitum]